MRERDSYGRVLPVRWNTNTRREVKVSRPKKHTARLSKEDCVYLTDSLPKPNESWIGLPNQLKQILLDDRRRLIRAIQKIRDSISDPSWECIEDILEVVASGRK